MCVYIVCFVATLLVCVIYISHQKPVTIIVKDNNVEKPLSWVDFG